MRNLKVEFGKLLFVIIMEHVLVFIQLFLAFAINDVPDWIVTAWRAPTSRRQKRDNARSRTSATPSRACSGRPRRRYSAKRTSGARSSSSMRRTTRGNPVELPVRAISFAKKKSQGRGRRRPRRRPRRRRRAVRLGTLPPRLVGGYRGRPAAHPGGVAQPGQSHDPANPQLVGWSRYASKDAEAIAASAGVSVGPPRRHSPAAPTPLSLPPGFHREPEERLDHRREDLSASERERASEGRGGLLQWGICVL